MRKLEHGEVVPRMLETVMKKRDGSTFPAYIESAWLNLPDGPAGLLFITDITSNKLAEDALRKSEEKYRTLVENLSDAVFTVNAKGYFTYISPAVEQIAGYKADKVIGQPFSQYIHPEDLQDGLEYFRLAMSGSLERHSFRIIKKDGAVCHVCANSQLVRRNGQPYLTGVLKDVTAYKLAVQELQHERDFSKAVLDTAGVLVAVFDLDGRIISFNRACEAMSGYTFQEVQGKVFWDLLIIPEERERVLNIHQDLINGELHDGENFWITKQGDLRLISWKNTVLLDDRNAVEYVIATGLDVTRHRQTDAALVLANKIFESTLAGIVVTGCDGIIQRINPAFTEITGYAEDDVVGKNISVLECDPEYHHKVVRALSESISYRGETWNRRRDGTLYLAGFVINAIKNDEGQNIQYVKSFRDITEKEAIRKERQQLQEQKARMQRLASLSALSAGIVHEIAQPLNSIKLLADGMLYLYEKGLFNLDDFGDNLKDISTQVEQITALIILNELIKSHTGFHKATLLIA
jgi:PAS domain S-box-containing protein